MAAKSKDIWVLVIDTLYYCYYCFKWQDRHRITFTEFNHVNCREIYDGLSYCGNICMFYEKILKLFKEYLEIIQKTKENYRLVNLNNKQLIFRLI